MGDLTGTRMSFWDHSGELLMRLRWVMAALTVSVIFMATAPTNIDALTQSYTNAIYTTPTTLAIERLITDLLPQEVKLLPMDLLSPFSTYLEVAIFLSVAVCSPIIAYQAYRFVNPALQRGEKKGLVLTIIAFTGLFVFGISLGYFVVTPITFRVLINAYSVLGLEPLYEFSSFLSLAMGLLLTCGLVFTFPVYLIMLIKSGMVHTSSLMKSRKVIYLVLLVVIAIMTPDPSPVDTIILYVPTVLLFEASILIGRRYEVKAGLIPIEPPQITDKSTSSIK